MGLYFGFSDFTASTYLTLLKPILKTALQQVTYLKKFIFKDQASFDKAFEGVEEIYIDVTEITVQRPQNEVLQEKKYSGEKKSHPKMVINQQ